MPSSICLVFSLLCSALTGTGALEIDVTDVLGNALPASVTLYAGAAGATHVPVPEGRARAELPAGDYQAYVYVTDGELPVLVDIKQAHVPEGGTGFLLVNLYEGTGGRLTPMDFDSDGDLVIDRVEVDAGTNPHDAASMPGREALVLNDAVLRDEERWYRGELHACSKHGVGKESVKALVRAAEKQKLDFLAITDRNTLASLGDKSYVSDKLVLIPAMEWGTDERGYALIYGPRTAPWPPSTIGAAQAECVRVQAQGGVFAVAHPCLREAPWTWGLGFVSAVEVWYQEWRSLPPLTLDLLDEEVKAREPGNLKLVHSIAAAAAAADDAPEVFQQFRVPRMGVSANRQSSLFYDYESVRGLRASLIGGSGVGLPGGEMGKPVTYIYARNKSLPALLEGMRLCHTYVSESVDGPQLLFNADVLRNKVIDVTMGGIIPTGVEVTFHVGVLHGKGKKLKIYRDGYPMVTKSITEDPYMYAFDETPTSLSAYRLAVVSMAVDEDGAEPGYGVQHVHALSSPIYSRDLTQHLVEEASKVLPDFDPNALQYRVDTATPEGLDRSSTATTWPTWEGNPE